jgi:hypothetical protein
MGHLDDLHDYLSYLRRVTVVARSVGQIRRYPVAEPSFLEPAIGNDRCSKTNRAPVSKEATIAIVPGMLERNLVE